MYNHEYDVTRPITITPTRSWGGEGALGCVLGFGALHRIPASLEEPPQAPGETLFSTDSNPASFDEKRAMFSASAAPPGQMGTTAALFVPANMALPSKSPPPPVGGGATPKKKARAHPVVGAAGGGGLDEYFKEGEQKSLEEDYAPKKGHGVPPPPKGPPPKSATSLAEGEAGAQSDPEAAASEVAHA